MTLEFHEQFAVALPDVEYSLSSFSESEFNQDHGLVVEIAAIHEGVTQNFSEYTSSELANGLGSWYTPYQKPVIMNHDKSADPVGRIIGAKMDQEGDGTSFVRLQAAITDPAAVQKILDRRYITGSIGGKTDEALCSICDVDWANPKEGIRGGPCSHRRGKVYKGKLATLRMKRLTFIEYSFVNVPADKLSGVRSVKPSVEESENWNQQAKFFVLDLSSESIVEYKEGVDEGIEILNEMKKKEATPLYHEIKGAFIQAQLSNNIENQESANAYIGDTTNNDSSIESNSEESKSMADQEVVDATEEEQEDILSITQELSDDLNTVDGKDEDSTEEESAEATEQSEAEDEVSDTTELDDESETDEAEQAQEDETAEADDSSDASDTREEEGASEEVETEEEAETDEEVVDEDTSDESTEAEEEETSEQADETELTESTKDESEQSVEELESRVEALEEENQNLKQALHRTLVERVVDTKIAVGQVEESARAEAVEDHESRTASSLADTLRDIAKLPKTRDIPKPTEEIEPKSIAVKGDEGKEPIEGADETTESEGPSVEQAYEDALVSVLMGRKEI